MASPAMLRRRELSHLMDAGAASRRRDVAAARKAFGKAYRANSKLPKEEVPDGAATSSDAADSGEARPQTHEP